MELSIALLDVYSQGRAETLEKSRLLRKSSFLNGVMYLRQALGHSTQRDLSVSREGRTGQILRLQALATLQGIGQDQPLCSASLGSGKLVL